MAIRAEEITLQNLFRIEAIADFSEKNFLVKDRFKVLELFFQTSRLNIYSGIDTQDNRRVFIHVLKSQGFLKGRNELQEWVQQLRKMPALKTDGHVLRVIDMGIWRKKFVFVSDFFEGVTLFDLLFSKRELPVIFVLRVLTGISRLLIEAKVSGFKSMTINKEELFLSKNGEIKILKFSPSRLDSIMPSAGCSDIGAIYSASCMLYEFFTNETPFQGPRTHAEQERAHLLAVLRVRSDKTCQDVYERIADLFLSGVTKNADKRVNVLEKFAAECERLWSDAIAIQEGLDDIEAREQLNSAFDVVAMLKGSGSEPQTKAVENEYSRVWRGMELKKKFNPDTETVFRWIAVSAIALSFGYRFFY